MIKKLLSLLTAAIFLAAPINANAAYPVILPDGLMDAKTRQNPSWPINVLEFQVIDLGNGSLLIAFVVQGHGLWWLYENCPGNPRVLLAQGRGTVKDDVQLVIVSAADYQGCYINLENVHGYAGPEL